MRLRERMGEIEKRLAELECSHVDIEYDECYFPGGPVAKMCGGCGKLLGHISGKEYNVIERDRLTSELKDVKAKISAADKK